MGDRMPGYTCPDLDTVLQIMRRWVPKEEIDFEATHELIERVRAANHQMRERCAELLAGQSEEARRMTQEHKRRMAAIRAKWDAIDAGKQPCPSCATGGCRACCGRGWLS